MQTAKVCEYLELTFTEISRMYIQLQVARQHRIFITLKN